MKNITDKKILAKILSGLMDRDVVDGIIRILGALYVDQIFHLNYQL